jgi:hypothetical protein
MKRFFFIPVGVAAAIALMCALVGCSADESPNVDSGLMAEVLDSVAAAVAENIVDSPVGPVEETLAVELAMTVDHTETGLPPINAMVVEGDMVNAAFDGGLLIYDLNTREYSVTPLDEDLRTVARHGGEMFVGGTRLYRVDGAALVATEEDIPAQITSLASFGPSLMIGTEDGLFARNILGCQSLLEDVSISAMVADANGGLWIGTDGDGLYRWDGERYRKRYLMRDSSLFDNVTALAYGHQHLYLGTTNGLYVHDGGGWRTLTVEEGLPSNQITAIDASSWVVYIGTVNGSASYFENQIKPIERLGAYVVTTLGRSKDRLIAGTAQNGLILKIGPSIKTLVEPWQPAGDGLASMIH